MTALFTNTWVRTIGLMALVAVICSPISYCKGYSHANQKRDAELALANKEAQDRALTTADKAATERVADAITVARQQTELTDAIADTPDTVPDAARVRLGCERLRQQGTNTADIPACR